MFTGEQSWNGIRGILLIAVIDAQTHSASSSLPWCKESQFYSLPFGQALANMY